MLAEEKIRIMSHAAMIENSREGKKAFRYSHYFGGDYIRWEVLKTITSVTAGYLLCVALWALYRSEYLIENAVRIDYLSLGKNALGIYIVLLCFYVAFSFAVGLVRAHFRKNTLHDYEKDLKKLQKYYKEQNELLGTGREEGKEV